MTRAAIWIAALAAAACAPPERGPRWKAAGAHAPRRGGTLHVATKEAVRSLDPTISYDEVSTYMTHALFSTLVTYQADSTALVPELAERWSVDPGGTTYTFVLRAHLRYEDGTPIVAADFKYSLERALTTADSPFAGFLTDVVGATDLHDGKASTCAGITATSERVLELRLTHPAPAFLFVLAMPFASPQRAAHVSGAGDQLRRQPLASGPFELASWDEGTQLVLRRNPQYWDPTRGLVDELVQAEHVAPEIQFLMLERGELDAADSLTAPDYLWITTQPAWAPYVQQRAIGQAFGSRMNVRKRPFDDRRVRQALNYALDKDHLLKLLNQAAVPSHGLLPPGIAGRDEGLSPYPHDPARARALLAEAGYPDGFAIDYVTQDDDQAAQLGASLQGDLAEVGIRVRLQPVSFATLLSTVGSADGPAFSLTSWIADYPDASSFLDARFHSRAIVAEGSTNDAFYARPEVDALLDAARGELDPARRAASYRQVERLLYDDAVWVFGYHPLTTAVRQPYVQGLGLHPVWVRDYTTVWLDLDDAGERVVR